MVLLEGATVGAYRIVEKLGEGSLATAYKAYHPALDRHVTLKVLKAGPNDDPSLRIRFQHEARQVARLDLTFAAGQPPTGTFEAASTDLTGRKSDFVATRIQRWLGHDARRRQ